MNRLVPLWPPGSRNGSNSWAQRILLRRCDHDTWHKQKHKAKKLKSIQCCCIYIQTVPVVSFHHELVSPRDQRQVVGVIESFGNVLAEGVAGSAGRNAPAASVVRIRPQQVAHGALKKKTKGRELSYFNRSRFLGSKDRKEAIKLHISCALFWNRNPEARQKTRKWVFYFVRDFLETVEGSDVVESVDGGRQSTVEAKDLAVNQGRQRQVVEEVRKVLPHIGVAILPQTFVVETVDLSDLPGFVVTSKDRNSLPVPNLA